jgi:hypothetical protein
VIRQLGSWRFAAWLVVIAALALGSPELLAVFGPALLLVGLLLRDVRPGERLIVRLISRYERRPRPAKRASRPQIPIVIRRTGRLIAAALAVRPPPVAALHVP